MYISGWDDYSLIKRASLTLGLVDAEPLQEVKVAVVGEVLEPPRLQRALVALHEVTTLSNSDHNNVTIASSTA